MPVAGLFREHRKGELLKVGEVEHPPLPLLFGIGSVVVHCEGEKAFYLRVKVGDVLPEISFGGGKKPQELLDAVLVFLPGGGNPVFEHAVKAPDRGHTPEGAEGERLPKIVPAFALAPGKKPFQDEYIVPEHRAVGLGAVFGAAFEHILGGGDAAPEHGLGVAEEDFAPDGFGNGYFRVVHLRLFREPVLIVGQGADKTVESEHRFAEPGVASPAAEGLGKLKEGFVPLPVAAFEGFLHGFGGNRLRLPVVGDPHVRGEPEDAEVFAYHVKAEGVYGADMSTLHQKLLAGETGVLRLLCGKLRKGGAYAAFHLRRSKVREGHDKEPVRVNGALRVREHSYHALDEDGGFAAARGGGNQEVSAQRGYCRKLFRVPVFIRHRARPLSPFYKIRRL